MSIGDKYATLSELKTRLGITDSNDDARLTNALATASKSVESFCERQFNDAGTTSTRVYRPDAIYMCQVYDFWTTAGLVIQVNSVTWDNTRYELDPLNGVVDGQTGWPYMRIHAIMGNTFFPFWVGKANVSVTAQWGWSAVPDPIHDATLVAAEEIFKLRDAPFGIGGYGAFGVISVRDNPFVARMCAPYARNPILAA